MLEEVRIDSQIEAFVPLSPIFVLSDIRPDLVMYKNSIPVLVIEVHSSPYEQTLRKLAFVLIEQLRLLRNLDETRDEVHGFSFPKSSEPSCVSQMTVTWNSNNLHFDVAYSVFKMEKVKENVEQAVSQIYHLQVSRFQGLLLSCNERQGIPLDKKFLVTFKEKLETGTLSQLHSKSSILLYDDRFLYKYIINDKCGIMLTKTHNYIGTNCVKLCITETH